jgi:hypothetical protein
VCGSWQFISVCMRTHTCTPQTTNSLLKIKAFCNVTRRLRVKIQHASRKITAFIFRANESFQPQILQSFLFVIKTNYLISHTGKTLFFVRSIQNICVKFGKFKTNQMHNFQLVYLFYFILFYFSFYMFRQAAIFKE